MFQITELCTVLEKMSCEFLKIIFKNLKNPFPSQLLNKLYNTIYIFQSLYLYII